MIESLFPTRWANDKPPSLEKFTSDFSDDYSCADYLAKKRWQSGFECPRCFWAVETSGTGPIVNAERENAFSHEHTRSGNQK